MASDMAASDDPPQARIQKQREERRIAKNERIEEVPPLTDQFFATLRAAAAEVQQLASKLPNQPLERVHLLLKKGESDPTWLDAYEIEQQLVHLIPESKVRIELNVRLVEAQTVLKPEKARAYSKEAEGALKQGAEAQRGLLSRLVNDLQWTYTVNEVKRQFWGTLTRRTAWMLAICAAMFLFSILVAQVAFSSSPPWIVAESPMFHPLSWRSLLLVCSAGAWGASFSMLLGLRKVDLEKVSLDQLKVMLTRGVFLARVCIGVGGALVLLFFMVSGILSGTVFPNFSPGEGGANPAATLVLVDTKKLVLLVLWCFIAGFSEKLVPGLLADSERRARAPRAERQPGDVERPVSSGTPPPRGGAEGALAKPEEKK